MFRNHVKIGVDIDGVLSRFDNKFNKKLAQAAGRTLCPDDYVPTCWDWPVELGYTEAETDAALDLVSADEMFWQTLDPYDWTAETLDLLHGRSIRGDAVYYITQRHGIFVKQQTEEWLRRNNHLRATGWREFCPTVLVVGHGAKGAAAKLLELDFYIDDKPENCEDVAACMPGPVVYMQNQPWNAGRDLTYATIRRVNSPVEMLKDIG